MLGNLIGEFKGKVSGYRVPELTMTGPKMEVTFQQKGKLLGVEAMDIATYLSVMSSPKTMYGEGSGAVKNADGSELAMYRGSGTAMMGKGMPGWRGVLYFTSQTPKWGVLNGIAVVYEYELDANENTHVKLWEWK